MDFDGNPVFIIAREIFDRLREDYPNTPQLTDLELMEALEDSAVAWEKDFMWAEQRIEEALGELVDYDGEEEQLDCCQDYMAGQICMLPKGHEGSHR